MKKDILIFKVPDKNLIDSNFKVDKKLQEQYDVFVVPIGVEVDLIKQTRNIPTIKEIINHLKLLVDTEWFFDNKQKDFFYLNDSLDVIYLDKKLIEFYYFHEFPKGLLTKLGLFFDNLNKKEKE